MNVFVILTTSLIENQYEIRKEQYKRGIGQVIKLFKNITNPKIKNLQIIIVENNNKDHSKTFLNDFNIPVIYTQNNYINHKNKGYKELKDINEIINKYNIQDDDFIIKITGRYFIHDDSLFMKNLQNIDINNFDAILRYGKYDDFQVYKTKQYICRPTITGMRCKYIKAIEYPDEHTDLEIKWSEATYPIPYERLCILDKLGINCYVNTDINPTVS